MTKTCFQDAFLPSCFIILIFLQLLPTVVHGNGNVTFDVIGPNEPILAIVGKDADLPCHLSPNISAKDMELRWYRDKFSPAVYVYERGKNVSGEQMEEYRGRTMFLIDHITNGTAAVRIHNVTVFDNGTYHCYFQEGTRHGEATLWLKVVGLGSQPRIRLRDDKDEGVQVECTSAGWYPQPQVEWRDFRGKIIPSVANLSVSPTSGLFAVVSNVVITDRAMEGLYCSIANPLLFKEKLTVSLLPASFSRSVWPKVWRISLPLILMALGLVVAGAICISWKKLRDEVRKRKETEDQQQASSDNGGQGSISLDPDTANPKLELSKDLKSVSRLLYTQDLPDNPERFNKDPCVLGQEQFTRGKHYWEVKVGNRKAWTLGVCLESLDRKGSIAMSPRHGLWAMEFCREELRALAIPRIHLHPSQPLQRVGIFLDYEAGNISFYNGADGSHVYTFSGVSFSGPLRPFFCLWLHDRSPLTICSGSRETGEVSGPLQVSELHQEASVTPVIERAASFSKDREPPLKRPMFFSPQSSPVLWKKHPSLKSQLDDILV